MKKGGNHMKIKNYNNFKKMMQTDSRSDINEDSLDNIDEEI